MQGLLHIVCLVRGLEDDCQHVMRGKGSLRAPPTLGNRTLLHRMNSRDLRCIAQLGAIRPGTLPRHSAAWAGVVG